MYTDNIFKELKSKIVQEFNAINTLKEFNRYAEWAKPHYELLKQLAEIEALSSESKQEINETVDTVTKKEETNEKSKVEDTSVDEYPIGQTFKFLKKAFGGVIDGLNYPITEELVRILHLENENKVKITRIKGHYQDGSPIYDFTIIDRNNIPNPLLFEVNQGVVKRIGSRFVVTNTVSTGTIKVEDSPAALYINDKDSARFKIVDGDIVDGRFYTNNIVNSFRVTYKYDTAEEAYISSIESRKLSHRQSNQSVQTESGNSMIERLDKTPFLGKKILLVGLASRVNDFKLSLVKTDDIEMVHLTGDEHKARIRAQILKADIVLLSTQENSHDATKYVASLCNDKNIPFKSTSGDGLFGILNDAKELIGKQTA